MANQDYSTKKYRLTPEDFRTIGQERGISWAGDGTPLSNEKTQWQCPLGHIWNAPYFVIQAGCGCPECAKFRRRKRVSTEAYTEQAEKWGLVWLGTESPGVDTPTGWRCSEGHEFKASLTNIRKGALCSICGRLKQGIKKRNKPEVYFELAEQQGLEWIGPIVTTVGTHTEWRCSCGHQWFATYENIKQGYLCPVCGIQKSAESRRFKPESYHKLAAERGFIWLGPEVPHVQVKTQWQCKNGHIWEAWYNAIHQGSGCPHCLDLVNGRKVSQVQRRLHGMIIGSELNYPTGIYNIDVALIIDDYKIAIEYDSWHWHKDRLEKDVERTNRLIADGWRVLSIKSNWGLPELEDLVEAINRLINGELYIEIILRDWGID